MKQISKKMKLSIIGATAFCITVASIITPVAYVTYNQDANIIKSSKFEYNGMTFNSYDELMKYVEDNTYQQEVWNNASYKWSINDGGKTKYYNSVSTLTSDAYENINVYDGITSLKYEKINSSKGALNELSNKVVSQMDLVPEGTEYSPDTVTVYQGRNNSVHTDETTAKKTYMSIHDAYYYDYIYFRNSSDLEQYLDQKSTDSAKNSSYFTLQDPNSNKTSSPINLSELNKLDFSNSLYLTDENYLSVQNFVKNYAKTFVSVQDNNNNYDYFDIDDKNTISNLNTYVDLGNISYTKVYSNQNKGSYVVDVSKDDDHNLTGPYIYNGGGNILSSNDKSNWNKSASAYEKSNVSTINEYVEDFLSILLNEYEEIPESSVYYNKEGMLFYFAEIEDSTDSLSGSSLNSEWYSLITNLRSNYNSVYKNLLSTYEQLQETKRYNSFYKLPILFTLIIQGLIREEAPNDIFVQTRNFFTNLTKRADKTLQAINNVTSYYGLDLLENKKSTTQRFSFTELFGFNNNNFDLSSNIESTLNNITEFYPNITLLMVISNVAISNNMMGIRRVESFIDSIKNGLNKFGINLDKQLSNTNAINAIYEIFSSSDLDYTCELLNSYSLESESYSKSDVAEMFFTIYRDNFLMTNSASNFIKDAINASKTSNYLYIERNYKLPYLSRTYLYDILSNYDYITTYDIADAWILNKILDDFGISNENLKNFQNFESILEYLYERNGDFDYWAYYNKFSNSFFTNYSESISKIVFTGMISDSVSLEEFLNISNSLNTIAKGITDFSGWATRISSGFTKAELEQIQQTPLAEFFDVFEALDLFKKISGVLKNIGTILSIACILLDMFVPKTEHYSYEFTTSDGTSLAWDGGQKTTMFFGLITIGSKGVNDMDYVSPILIQDPIAEDYYYCNGKKYYDTNTLKTEAFKDFINNKNSTVLSDTVKKVYSFSSSVDSTSGKENSTVTDSIDELTKNIILDIQNKGTGSQYFNSKVYKFSNGYSSDLNAVVNNEKEKIMNEILSTKLTILPNLDDNGYPVFDKTIYEANTNNDGSTNTFVLPGNQWNSLTFSVEVDERYYKNNYLIVNPNELVEPNEDTSIANTKTNDEAIEELTNMFLSSFEVKQKIVTKQDFINETEFSNLASKYEVYKIYQVNDTNYGSLYFMNEADALNYYFSINSMKLHDLTQSQYNYVFDDLIFKSKDDLYAYIKSNAKEVW